MKHPAERRTDVPVKPYTGGPLLGWVQGPLYTARGGEVEELLLQRHVAPHRESDSESGEGLIGCPLHLTNGHLLGTIVDVVGGRNSGQVLGLIIESSHTGTQYAATAGGMVHENGHWTLLENVLCARDHDTNQNTWAREVGVQDWMIGRKAQSELHTAEGSCIIEPGQVITEATIALAAREGLLHLLDAY